MLLEPVPPFDAFQVSAYPVREYCSDVSFCAFHGFISLFRSPSPLLYIMKHSLTAPPATGKLCLESVTLLLA